MTLTATIDINKEVYPLFKPEAIETKRSKVEVSEGKIKITARDAVSFQAMITSILKLIRIWEKI